MSSAKPSVAALALGYACLYLIWGSTYLAIRVAVETMPPLLMSGVRFLIAGPLLLAFTLRGNAPRPAAIHWRTAAIAGTLLIGGGNGAVSLAEKTVPSGTAALIVALMPIWMMIFEALLPQGARPTVPGIASIFLGTAGVWVLVDPSFGEGVDPFGAGLVIFATISWAAGSLYSRYAPSPPSPFQAASMQMILGGVVLLVCGTLRGEWHEVDPASFSTASIIAVVYLIVFGSLIAYSTFVWLMKVSTPSRVATYTYVNPAVAVLLGWAILAEPIGADTLAATVLIVGAVVLATWRRNQA